MLTTFGQYIGGKAVTAVLVVSGAGALIWFWRHPEDLQTIWQTLKYVVVWLGFVLVLPWATFFVTPWIVSKDSNFAAGLMLAGYVVLDAIVAFCLIGRISGLRPCSRIMAHPITSRFINSLSPGQEIRACSSGSMMNRVSLRAAQMDVLSSIIPRSKIKDSYALNACCTVVRLIRHPRM